MTRPAAILLAWFLFGSSTGWAHKDPVAHLTLSVDGKQVVLVFRAFATDLSPLVGLAAGQRRVPIREFLDQHKQLLRTIERDITVYLGERRICPMLDGRLEVEQSNRLRITLVHKCPLPPQQLQVQYDLLFDQVHNHLAHIRVEGQPRNHFVFTRDHRIFILDAEISLLSQVWGFLRLGILHIVTGYDHMLFLLALMLVAGAQGRSGGVKGGLRYLATIVSAFTIAHSMTLVGSALGYIDLPHRAVDTAIALSIVYVAVENLTSGHARRRWLLTFVFGLVHGFGFATTLRQTGLPRQGLLLSLVCFNLGVEVGQLSLVFLAFPGVLWLAVRRERIYQVYLLSWGSVTVGVLGVGWFFYRLLWCG